MELKPNQVALVTGAASGIGKGLVQACAGRKMRIVAADIDAAKLAGLSSKLAALHCEHVVWQGDVADPQQVAALAELAYERYGEVNLLCNNAGVMFTGLSWECSVEVWKKTLDINLFGALHGIQQFVPRMLQQSSPAHIVNTASLAGLLASPLMGPYSVSKHALVALSETLHYELQSVKANIGVSVLCPAQVASNIMQQIDGQTESEPTKNLNAFLRSGINQGMAPAAVAAQVLAAVEQQQFWIFTHPDFKSSYLAKAQSLVDEVNPLYQQLVCD